MLYFFLLSFIGTILHFTYKLSKNSIIVGIISSVNESIWEHIKLLLTPIFFINTINYILGRRNNFFIVLFVNLIISITLIILFYILINRFIKNEDIKKYFYITSFYTVALLVSILGQVVGKVRFNTSFYNMLCAYLSLIIFIMYLTFTVFPPKCFIFIDPITKTYGINRV